MRASAKGSAGQTVQRRAFGSERVDFPQPALGRHTIVRLMSRRRANRVYQGGDVPICAILCVR